VSKKPTPASRPAKAASKASAAHKSAVAPRSTGKAKPPAKASRPTKAATKATAARKTAAAPRPAVKAKPAPTSRPSKAVIKTTAAHKPAAAPRPAVKVKPTPNSRPTQAATKTTATHKPVLAPKGKIAIKAGSKAASPKSGKKATDTMITDTKIQVPTPKPVEKKPSKAAARAAAARIEPPPAPDMSRLVGSSRFADRFAPPKPPTRQMNSPVIETLRVAAKPDPKLANAWKTKSGREMDEAEIFAMPDREYMNEKQLDFFRGKLLKLKEDLLSNAGETTEHLREDTSIVPDPADRATIEEEHALELRTRDRERKLLKKITQSLARLETGEYGYCDETGEPIGLGRLIARPTATLSLEAQQRREMKQKMFGD